MLKRQGSTLNRNNRHGIYKTKSLETSILQHCFPPHFIIITTTFYANSHQSKSKNKAAKRHHKSIEASDRD